MEPSDLISSLLQNPEAMQRLSGMASQLMQGAPPGQQTGSPPTALPASIGGKAPDPTAELMQKALPAFSAIARSGQQQANTPRVQLLHALRPFVSPEVSGQIDHAEHVLSLARMAKAALSQMTTSGK